MIPGFFLGKLLFLDVLAPSVRIVDTQAIIKFPSMLGDEELPQREAAGADL
jgi:hypothetical protein